MLSLIRFLIVIVHRYCLVDVCQGYQGYRCFEQNEVRTRYIHTYVFAREDSAKNLEELKHAGHVRVREEKNHDINHRDTP